MSQQQRTVLIIDDSPSDRELYRQYLLRDQEFSYTILEATLGRQGLEIWQQRQPDVVLLDYRLPDLDGLEFLANLSSSTQEPCLPVIIVTGQGNETISVKAIKAGAQDYLVKEQITQEGLQLAVKGTIETVQLHTQLQRRIERERVIAQITQQIYQSLNLEKILQTTVTEVRGFLHTDRVLIFELEPDGNGTIIAESVGAEWRSLFCSTMHDPCLARTYVSRAQTESVTYDPSFTENYVERYRQGWVSAKSDIWNANIDPCYAELLAQFQVKANLVVPLLHEGELWGMLIAHHCADLREWQPLEINLLKELAIHVGIALQQAELYRQARDEIAERQKVEAELRESEELLRTSVENMLDCFGIYRAVRDEQGQIVDFRTEYVNDAACRNNRMSREEQLGRGLCELLPGHCNSGLFDEYCQVVETGQSLIKDTLVYEDDDGQQRLVRAFDIRVAKFGDGFVATWRDITDRIQTEATLRENEHERERILQQEQAAREEAERANRIKDEFLAILSHELRSPLNPILGWTKLMQSRRFDEAKTAEALASIERNVKLQTQLIDDLLDVAKILRGKLNMDVAAVNLVFVIEAALDTVRTAAVSKSILLHSVLPNIGQVSGDAVRLQQIVWNLLSNAIKFTPQGGRVEIRLEQVNDQAQIIVSDTGKGIHPDFLAYLFESFRQEDSTTTRKYGGLGLGLAIVRNLVEAHGGTVSAESPGEGQGATFTVRLPLLDSAPAINVTDLEEQEADLTGIRVLTVDDEPDTRELLTILLTQYGAEVMTVTSADEALVALESFQPDVLISDIGMPDIDGYTLLQQIRSRTAYQGGQVPAIALTAYAGEADQQRALAVGFQQHIAKPIEPNRLAQAVVALARGKFGLVDCGRGIWA